MSILTEVCETYWIYLAQDRVQCLTLLKTVMKRQFWWAVGAVLNRWSDCYLLKELRDGVYTELSKKMDGIWNRYNLKSTGRIYTFCVLKYSEKFKVLGLL